MLIELDERGEKLCHVVAQILLQHIGSPRLFEVQHRIGEMGHIDFLTTGIERVVTCIMNQLAELHRCSRLFVAVGRQMRLFHEPRVEFLNHDIRIHTMSEQGSLELRLLQEGIEHMLRAIVLVAQIGGILQGCTQRLAHILCISHCVFVPK